MGAKLRLSSPPLPTPKTPFPVWPDGPRRRLKGAAIPLRPAGRPPAGSSCGCPGSGRPRKIYAVKKKGAGGKNALIPLSYPVPGFPGCHLQERQRPPFTRKAASDVLGRTTHVPITGKTPEAPSPVRPGGHAPPANGRDRLYRPEEKFQGGWGRREPRFQKGPPSLQLFALSAN